MDLTAELVALVENRAQVRSQTPPNILTRNLIGRRTSLGSPIAAFRLTPPSLFGDTPYDS
jgi:hypothetical protein